MTSWGETLIEWCNCLQLGPKLKDINELRESDFFQNILSILNRSDASGTRNQPFFLILTLLNETYQNAQIEDINCDSFTELPEDKFLIITSLLLHYTCLYDGREQFTLPLCQNLSKKLQLSIKDFLEKVHKEVTYSDLEKLIVQEKVYEYVESKQTRPLTAVFRTPSLKRKFNFEKDRTVNKLKTALELEQYEKADVEEELTLQLKKTQKLEKLLSKSNDEISTLKSEIFKLRCQTPPQCSKKHSDSEHKMRLMRKELENFEQYIENSEKEHEKLREEHHLYKQKIEDYEAEYANIRSKHLAYEKQIHELNELLQERSAKVTHLETHCKELNEILEGFRQKPPESTENSFSEYVPQTKMDSSFVNQENLASTVIEIQLKEAHEQIDQLNCRVAAGEELNKESIEKIEILEKELNLLLRKQTELENQLICEKENHAQEIQHIGNELKIFEKENKEISNTIVVLQESLDNLNLERNNQLIELEKRGEKILELENTISTLKTETEKWSADFKSKDQELEEVTSKYNESLSKLRDYANFKQNMKQHVDQLKAFHKDEFLEYTNLILKLKESMLLYDNKLTQSEEIREKLLTELNEKNELNSSLLHNLENLKDEIKKIGDDWTEDKKQKESMLTTLTESEKTLISEKERHIAEIERIKIERNGFCDELRTTQKKNNEISNRIIVLQESLDHLNLEKNNQLNKIEHQNNKITELENSISILKIEAEKLSSDVVSKSEELKEINTKYEESQRKLVEYTNFEQNMKQHLVDFKMYHQKEFNGYTNLISKLKGSIEEYDSKLTQTENLRKKLHVELNKKNEWNSSLLSDLENLKEEFKIVSEKWNKDKKQKESMLVKLSELEYNLISEKERYSLEIEEIKNERNIFRNELKISEEKIEDISRRNTVLQEMIDISNSEKSDQEKEIEEQKSKLLELENIISESKIDSGKLNSELKSKHDELEELMTKYKKSQNQLEELIDFKQNIKQNIAELKAFHKEENCEFLELISKVKESVDLQKNKLEQSEHLRHKLLVELDEMKAHNSSLLLDQQNLKEELNKITSKWDEDKKQKENLLEKLSQSEALNSSLLLNQDNLKEELNKIILECNEHKKQKEDLLEKLSQSETLNSSLLLDQENLKEELNKITLEWNEDKKQKENLLEKLSQLEDLNSSLLLDQDNLKEELNKITLEWNEDKKQKENLLEKLSQSEATNSSLLSDQDNLKEELKKITLECNEHKKQKEDLLEKLSKSEALNSSLLSDQNNLKKELNKFTLEGKEDKKQKEDVLEKLSQAQDLNSSLLLDQDNLKEELNKITSQWNEDKKQLENLLEKLSQLEKQMMNEREQSIREIEKIKNERNNLCNELRISEKGNMEISKKISNLQDTIDELNSESDNKLQKMGKDGVKISELENFIADLSLANSDLISKNTELQEVVTKYENSTRKLEKYANFEKNIKQQIIDLKSFHQKESYDCSRLLSNLREYLGIYDNKLTISEEQRNELTTALNETRNSNSSLSVDLNKLKDEMNVITSDWCEDKKQVERIKIENQSLKDNFIGLTKTIKLFNDELNKVVRSLKERKNKSNSILNKMQMSYKEINTSDLLKTPEKNSKSNDVSSEINVLGEQISKLNVYIDIFSEKETFYLKELESLKEELAVSNNNRFDVIQTLKEQILENEHQISSQTESLHSLVEKYNHLQTEKQECLNKIEKYEEEINQMKKSHSDEITLKDLNISALKDKIQLLEEDFDNLKKVHSKKTEEFLEKIVILQDQNSKDIEQIEKYKTKIVSLEAQIAIFKEDISQIKNKTSLTEEEYETNLANLQVQVVRNKLEITELKKKNEDLANEKGVMSTQLNTLEIEKDQEIETKKILDQQLTETNRVYSELKNENSALMKELENLKELKEKCNRCEQERSNKRFSEEKQIELSQKIETLMKSGEMQKESYEVFKIYYKKFKDDLDKLLSQKNSLENLSNNLRTQIISLNKYVTYENSKKIAERKEALDVISEDIIKQYNRYSKQINDIVQELVKYYEKNCDNIFASLELKIEDCLEKYNVPELSDQLSDLTERTVDILEQIKATQRELENSCKEEDDKIQQKENILATSRKINIDKMKEDDLKKKNLTLRQKITLLENTKSNLEKTVKKLREENKKLKENDNKDRVTDDDSHYKMILQEYICYKEDQEKVLKEYKMQLEDLQKEYEEHKNNCMRTSTPIGDVFFSQPENDKHLEAELENLKIAFSNVRISNEKLETENMLLNRIASEHKDEIGKFTLIKEAYDKLLEENNKLMTEVDTMKYKRARDRDEFLRWLKKDRHDKESKNVKMIQSIKAEYETKLEKMKDKMIKLYREEVNKEMSKIKGRQNESTSLVKTVEQLECDLFEAKQKIQLLMERDSQNRIRDNQMHGSNSQLHELDTLSLKDFPLSCMNSTANDNKPRTSMAKFMEFKHPNKVNPSSLDTRRQYEERQVKTLPRTGTVIEEVNIRRKTSFGVPNSIGNLPMEDEEEMFNNKYLTDLKQGNCELPAEGRDSRVSELAWRNSLVPPHLKSSYPAETQFCSPERFREDDIKIGSTFDDSSSKLLPTEKRKKDFGTTSYKKPGPPTPSKNGGRLSLTGSDIQAAKEQPTDSKKHTGIRALFSGRSSSRNSIEPGASPKKRLSIFRK